jgi:hypothetical protein
MQERIDRCKFMYALFTRVYDLWYRGSDLPISPLWEAVNFKEDLADNAELIRVFSNISHLEVKFRKFLILLFQSDRSQII